ncbi:hypothetical protein CDAR_442111 [Caerostris darwini]|uniref:Uncharacterized protein n=1 Tax=Caerostris darwini TaxID=1538125 RepID=A0AAV4UZW6_9ARAC|nr:hypothetical protein CDAR_442111 [Caerostris darwini]
MVAGRHPPPGYRPRVGGSPIPHAALLSWAVLPRPSILFYPLYDSNALTALRQQMVPCICEIPEFMSTFRGDLKGLSREPSGLWEPHQSSTSWMFTDSWSRSDLWD